MRRARVCAVGAYYLDFEAVRVLETVTDELDAPTREQVEARPDHTSDANKLCRQVHLELQRRREHSHQVEVCRRDTREAEMWRDRRARETYEGGECAWQLRRWLDARCDHRRSDGKAMVEAAEGPSRAPA